MSVYFDPILANLRTAENVQKSLGIDPETGSPVNFLNQKGEFSSFPGLIFLAACTGLGEYLAENAFTMTWIDPDNVTLNGATLAEWNQTVLVRKVGSYPADQTDGTVLATTSRALGNKNAYRSNGFTDSSRESGTTYYYKLFSQTTGGVWNNLAGNQFVENTDMSWGMIQSFVRAGRGPDLFPVGTVFEVEHPEYTDTQGNSLFFRVVGHDQVPAADEALTHTMCLDMVNILFSAPYDAPESLYALTEDTTAQANKTYYTLSGSTYTALAEGTDYEVGDSVPVSSWYEKNNNQNNSGGSNHPAKNNVIQWANSSGNANQWFVKQTIWDACSNDLANKNGFCKHIDHEFLAVVASAKLITALSTYDGGGSLAHNAKFWPLSLTQLFGTENGGVVENLRLSYYEGGASTTKTTLSGDTASWRCRSPFVSTGSDVYMNIAYTAANNSRGISLACIIA